MLILLSCCLVSNFAWADIFNIYTDVGIPNKTELYTWDGISASFQEISDHEAPERVKYFKTVSHDWAGWGVFFHGPSGDYTLDLSEYNQGSLKFFVKTPVNLKVEIQEQGPGGPKRTKYISNYGWNGLNDWQEIAIPLSAFGANLSQIFSPFMVTAQTSATFYVDYTRLAVPISGYVPTSIQVNGRQLLVDENIFDVKGVAAEFTPIGEYSPGYDWSLHIEDYETDISLIKEMGANVIRTYAQRPTQKEALDRFYENGIYVIMGFHVDSLYGGSQVVDFGNPVVRENIKVRFLEMIEHWKDHPGILMWCFGNEVNQALEEHGEWSGDWYSLIEECAQAAHQLEGENYHPVTTANSDQIVWDIGDNAINADDSSMPSLDLWSLQMYRGPTFADAFTTFENLTDKPLLITEFGCDAYDSRYHQEDQAMQADYLSLQYSEINENLSSIDDLNVCVGAVAFSWRDGWYKSSHGTAFTHDTQTDWIAYGYEDPNMNEEWWGLVSISDNDQQPDTLSPRQAYNTLKQLYSADGSIFSDDFEGVTIDETKWTVRDRAVQLDGKAVFQGDGTIYRQDSIVTRKNFKKDKNLIFKTEFSFDNNNPGFHIVLSGAREWNDEDFHRIWLTVNGGTATPGFRIMTQQGTDNDYIIVADSNAGDPGFPVFNTGISYTLEFHWFGDSSEFPENRLEVYLYETALGIGNSVYIWDVMDWNPRFSAEIYNGNGTSCLDSLAVFGSADAVLDQNVPEITGFQDKQSSYYAGENIIFYALGDFSPGAEDSTSNTVFTWAKHQELSEYPAQGSYMGYANGLFRFVSPCAGTYYFTVRIYSDTGLMDARRFEVVVKSRKRKIPAQQMIFNPIR